MGNFLRIPGETPLPLPRPSRPRPGATGFLILVFVSLCTASYALVRYWPSLVPKSDTTPALPTPLATSVTPATIPTAEAGDLLHHLDAADAKALKASAEIRRSADFIARVSPSLEREYMTGEKRRLDVANAALESARHCVEQAREELEITKNLLAERSK